jgi:tRNA nucleotidyltransferase (CCA-adding enzyme)
MLKMTANLSWGKMARLQTLSEEFQGNPVNTFIINSCMNKRGTAHQQGQG